MECSCYCDYDDGEPVKCYTDWVPTARKEHTCCECKETIKPGQRYHRQKYLWEGQWWDDITCLPCKAIRDDFAPCSIPGDMVHDVYECLGFWIFGPTEEIEED